MLRILPYINGLNSVRQIALLADADYKLVRKAIKHLLYYGCLLLLDIFSFGAIYAPTAELPSFVEDQEVQAECARYITIPDSGLPGSTARSREGSISGTMLVELYCAFKQGQTVKSWYVDHADALAGIDIRRFITFGVIKGIVYRVHKYPIGTKFPKSNGNGKARHLTKSAGAVDAELAKHLDGTHCFDEICTELMISERELVGRLKACGDVQIIHR